VVTIHHQHNYLLCYTDELHDCMFRPLSVSLQDFKNVKLKLELQILLVL